MKLNVTVIGLGAFGSTVALELTRLGNDVLGIDVNPDRTNDIADRIAQAVVADARDERVLRDLGVHESDVAVIAIGENIEANILATLLVKAMPKPKVWVKALNHNHYQILQKLGAENIVLPEQEMGLRMARALLYPQVIDYFSLGDDYLNVAVCVSEKLAGKDMSALQLDEHEVQCLLVKSGVTVMVPPQPEYRFKLNDTIILLGSLRKLRNISKLL